MTKPHDHHQPRAASKTKAVARESALGKPKQEKLFDRCQIQERPFGGSLLKNSHAKTKRPFAPRAVMHITMKTHGYGRLIKPGRRSRIDSIIRKIAASNWVKLHNLANAGNHIHLLIEVRTKEGLTGFLRGVSGAIARFVLAEESRSTLTAKVRASSFWLQRPWSRILSWSGLAFFRAYRYVDLNSLESFGVSRSSAQVLWDVMHWGRLIKASKRVLPPASS